MACPQSVGRSDRVRNAGRTTMSPIPDSSRAVRNPLISPARERRERLPDAADGPGRESLRNESLTETAWCNALSRSRPGLTENLHRHPSHARPSFSGFSDTPGARSSRDSDEGLHPGCRRLSGNHNARILLQHICANRRSPELIAPPDMRQSAIPERISK